MTTPTLVGVVSTRRPDSPVKGTLYAAALVATATVVALGAGLGGVLSVGYPVAAVMVAVPLLRRDRGAYLVFVLWMWLLTPEVRRVADFTAGWDPHDPIMITPGIVSLVALGPLLRQRFEGRMANAALITAAAVVYGFFTGIIQVGPTAALAGLLYWLPPPIIGLLALGPGFDKRSLRVALDHTCVYGAFGLGLYGVIQFLWLPPWDMQWMTNSTMTTIGLPVAQQVRVFSTLNAPGPFGMTMAALLVGLAGAPSRLRIPAIGLGGVALGLSLVRSGWVGLAFGVALLLILGGRGRTLTVFLAALPIVIVIFIGGNIGQTINTRFLDTVHGGTSDQSLVARLQFHQEMVPRALSHPAGNGVGSTGLASGEAGSEAQTLANFDGAIPESLFTLGGVMGMVFLAALAFGLGAAIKRARSCASSVPPAAAAFALAMQALFGNPFIAVGGVFMFAFLAAAVRPEVACESSVQTAARLESKT